MVVGEPPLQYGGEVFLIFKIFCDVKVVANIGIKYNFTDLGF